MNATQKAKAKRRRERRDMDDARYLRHHHKEVPTSAQARQGSAIRKLRTRTQFQSGQHFETDGKTLGFMDANMKEHRVQMSVTPRMPNWIRKDTAKDARNGIYHL